MKLLLVKYYAAGIMTGAIVVTLLMCNTTGNTETIYARPTVTFSVFNNNLFLWKLITTNSGSAVVGTNNTIMIDWKWDNYEKSK